MSPASRRVGATPGSMPSDSSVALPCGRTSPHARGCEIKRSGRTEAAGAHDGDMRRLQPLLTRPADFLQQDMARVAFAFFGAELHCADIASYGVVCAGSDVAGGAVVSHDWKSKKSTGASMRGLLLV